PVADLLDGDLRVGNLETPTSPDHPTELGALGLYSFNAPPALLDGLPLDLVQVNNNHSLDAGDTGLEATLAELDARGIAHTGVDEHAIVEVAGRRIAFLSYTWGLNEREVESTHELFVVPFGHLTEDIDLSGIEDDIRLARDDGAQTVVLLVHWGFEYEYYPDPHFLVLGRRLVTLGADLVVGQGPHVAQPPEICHVNHPEVVPGVGTCSVRTPDEVPRTAAVLYSLGNFETIMGTVPCQTGLVATVTLEDDVTGLGWTAVANVDTAAHELHPLDALLDDPEWAEESSRLDAHLGRSWRRGENR
ncbi:MAG: CapA family protein, partial [Deltaproteobacteria bacterium]|nr:CapA family protein [Deltaproteobacteria bacterium]